MSESVDAQIALQLEKLRTGTSAEKIAARSFLASVFIRRRMFAEAAECLETNLAESAPERQTVDRLAMVYRLQGRNADADLLVRFYDPDSSSALRAPAIQTTTAFDRRTQFVDANRPPEPTPTTGRRSRQMAFWARNLAVLVVGVAVIWLAGRLWAPPPAAPPPAALARDDGAAATMAPGELGRTDVDTEVFAPLPGRLRPPRPDSARPAPDYAAIRPNELGKIMVLEYHVIGDEELRWTRTRENFRKDLEYLHRHGYYLVGMRDLLEDRVRVPAGKTPVVLTFDDSNRSQFQFIAGPGGQLVVDPTSGLGILEAFIEEHPDFGRAGVFCVLPGADPPNDLFGQPEHRQRKLQYLVGRGYELCNHTLWHALLDRTEAEEIVRQLALTQKAIREAVPGYEVRVFCPPGGAYPDDLAPVLEGTHDGEHYQHWAILEVTGGPMTAPGHRDTDFLHVPRIQAIPDELKYWFRHFEENSDERYVSDGDPDRVAFPTVLAGHIGADLAAKVATIDEASSDPDYRVLRLR